VIMAKVPLYNARGEYMKTLVLDADEVAPSVNLNLIQRAVLAFEANQRQGSAKTKERAEVAGTNRKPWRQKGTGRARAGRTRSPLWRGGGTTFGPRPRDFGHRLPVKARRNAAASALRAKLEDGKCAFIEAIELAPLKTKTVASILKAMAVKGTVLIGTEQLNPELWRCSRNIPGVQVLPVDQVNAWHLFRYGRAVFTPESFERLKSRVGNRKALEVAP